MPWSVVWQARLQETDFVGRPVGQSYIALGTQQNITAATVPAAGDITTAGTNIGTAVGTALGALTFAAVDKS